MGAGYCLYDYLSITEYTFTVKLQFLIQHFTSTSNFRATVL